MLRAIDHEAPNFENFRARIEVTQRLFDDKVRLRFGLLGRSDWRESTVNGGSFRGVAYSQATRRNPTEPRAQRGRLMVREPQQV